MLDAKLICEIKESEKVGDKITKEFKELDCAIDSNSIGGTELVKYLAELNARYNEWRMNHERLIISAYK